MHFVARLPLTGTTQKSMKTKARSCSSTGGTPGHKTDSGTDGLGGKSASRDLMDLHRQQAAISLPWQKRQPTIPVLLHLKINS